MTELGQLSRIDPREVWKGEATDFTPWLAKNLDLLGEVLGLDLEFIQREASTGDFSVDILARDLGRDRVVVIENQFKATDHTHLGQIITYAAGLDAGVVIWISSQFRDEHRQALDWLNRAHEGHTEFFGVLLELLRVDNSKPAVYFRPVAFPNQWSRSRPGAVTSNEVSPKLVAYQQFFQRLLDELREQHKFTNARAAQPMNWYSFSAGVKGFSYSFSFALGGRIRAELYIDTGNAERNEQILDELLRDRSVLEKEFGQTLEWERLEEKRGCRIACYRSGNIEESTETLDEMHRWAIDNLLLFKKIFGPRLRTLVKSPPVK